MTHHEHPNVTLVREGFAAFERGDMARMDQLLSDDVVWHVGGNSKWAGAYAGKAKVLEYFGRQGQATATEPGISNPASHPTTASSTTVTATAGPRSPSAKTTSDSATSTTAATSQPTPVVWR
jgi:ketosteroid isomerase-like protein